MISNQKESDKKKLEVLKDATYLVNSEMMKLTSIREDIHAINKEKWNEKISKIKNDLGAKQTLLFIGPFSSGKSSFINAILGQNILPTNSRPCTSVVTELKFKNDGSGHFGKAIKKDGTTAETSYDFNDLIKMIDGPTGAIGQCASYHHIELEYDIAQLPNGNTNLSLLCDAGVSIIDCPGYESPYACSEDIIDEYIGKATHTFWMNPIDQFGGSFEINKIKAIRNKTTTLIPIFTKSDLKPDEDERNEIREMYSETIGGLFRQKEPIFTSAKRWKDGLELAKQQGKEEDVDKLFLESGIHKFLTAMIDVTANKEVTEAKVSSCRIQLDNLIEELKISTQREKSFWQQQLNDIGWNENMNTALNEIKRDTDEWIKNEAQRAGNKFNTHLKESVVNYVYNAGNKFSRNQLEEIIANVWKEEINNNGKLWAKELQKIYQEKVERINFDNSSSIDLPNWLKGDTISKQIKDLLNNIMDSISRSGLVVSLEAVSGATLWGLAGECVGANFLGHTVLANILGIAGPIILGVAALTIIPTFMKLRKEQKIQNRKEIERNVENWLDKFDTTNVIKSILIEVNEETFNKLSEDSDKEATDKKRNYNICLSIEKKLNEIHANILQQFSSSIN